MYCFKHKSSIYSVHKKKLFMTISQPGIKSNIFYGHTGLVLMNAIVTQSLPNGVVDNNDCFW